MFLHTFKNNEKQGKNKIKIQQNKLKQKERLYHKRLKMEK